MKIFGVNFGKEDIKGEKPIDTEMNKSIYKKDLTVVWKDKNIGSITYEDISEYTFSDRGNKMLTIIWKDGDDGKAIYIPHKSFIKLEYTYKRIG